MRLFLNRINHLHKAADVVGRHPAGDRLFEVDEVVVHLPGDTPAFRGRRDDEGAPIELADGARDEAALFEAIEDAGQGRTFVGQTAMQIGDSRRRPGRELRQNVRLALREAELPEVSEIQPDAVCRAMDARDETKRHRWNRVRARGFCPAAAGRRAAPSSSRRRASRREPRPAGTSRTP
jgi:hypothetical protein